MDLYDENKKLTGEKVFREKGKKALVPNGKYTVVVLAFIQNSLGSFLLQKTSVRKKGVWAVSGGHVKSGQNSLEAIKEELREELGLNLKNNEIELFKTYKYDTAFSDVFYIHKDIDLNKLVFEPDEVEYATFLSKDKILELISDGTFRKNNIEACLDIFEKYT